MGHNSSAQSRLFQLFPTERLNITSPCTCPHNYIQVSNNAKPKYPTNPQHLRAQGGTPFSTPVTRRSGTAQRRAKSMKKQLQVFAGLGRLEISAWFWGWRVCDSLSHHRQWAISGFQMVLQVLGFEVQNGHGILHEALQTELSSAEPSTARGRHCSEEPISSGFQSRIS